MLSQLLRRKRAIGPSRGGPPVKSSNHGETVWERGNLQEKGGVASLFDKKDLGRKDTHKSGFSDVV